MMGISQFDHDIEYAELRFLELRGEKCFYRESHDKYDAQRRDSCGDHGTVSKNAFPMFWRFELLRHRQHVDIPTRQHFPAFGENGDDDESDVYGVAVFDNADVYDRLYVGSRLLRIDKYHIPFGAVRSRDDTPLFGVRTHRTRRP